MKRHRSSVIHPFPPRTDLPHQSPSIPELLAPAGGPSALRAAVVNGADAVYLGVDRLNARRGAENFTVETLAEACEFSHLRGVRVYLTANVVVLPDEMGDALDVVAKAWSAGVDAVIVQDIGLMRCIRSELPEVRIHASTQVNAHSSSTIAALAAMGTARVTLARETSLPEIARLVEAGRDSGVEIESFVHGALCMCYSGQCLLSSLIGGRSANRGMCAQPCRLRYELVRSGTVFETPGAHLLSPKDLAGIGALPELLTAGVASLKIEGRMKSAEYVAIVTGVYRAALNRAAESPESFSVRDGEMAVLSEAFSRGFTEAYLRQERGNEMMSYQRPNNRGVFVGRVSSADSSAAFIDLETALSSRDLIEVWTGRGRFTQEAGPLGVSSGERDEAPAGSRVRVRLAEPAQPGDRVFRVRNAALLDAAARSFSGADIAPVAVGVQARVVIGEPLRVAATTAEGACSEAVGDPVEPARTRPVSAEDVREHVGRFGGSGFSISDWDLALSPGAGVSFSELHRVRREALGRLRNALLSQWADRPRTIPRVPAIPQQRSKSDGPVRLVAVVSNMSAARACLQAGADRVQIPIEAMEGDADDRISPVLPRTCHDAEEQRVRSALVGCRSAVAATLGLLDEAAKRCAHTESHWSLNVTNSHAAVALAERGATLVWLSPELTAGQVSRIAAESPVPVGLAVLGRQELMVTEHCVLMAEGPCSRHCTVCPRREGASLLRDRKGYEFPVVTDTSGRSHIYNAVSLDLTGSLDEVLATGVDSVRLDLETDDTQQAARSVERARALLEEAAARHRPTGSRRRNEGAHSAGRRGTGRAMGTTTGHFFRGVS